MTRARGMTCFGVGVIALFIAAPAIAAARPAPGVVSQGPLSERDFARMERGGVETLRFLVRWSQVEPSRGALDWSTIDTIVGAAARHRIEPLPVVYGSPAWIAEPESHPPLDGPAERAAWGGFLTALAERYGRGGSLWSGERRREPIRRWQIWNEPNFDFYWDPRPSASEYARLVSISRRALDAADRRAKLILGGVAAVRHGVPWWSFLPQLYAVRGLRRDFDAVALHPYSPGIRLLRRQIRLAREVMREAGDARKPLAVTEIGWASGGSAQGPLVVGPRRQARLLERAFALLERGARRWRISDIDWYAWQDSNAVEALCFFCERAGLFDLDGDPKPAWAAFRRATR